MSTNSNIADHTNENPTAGAEQQPAAAAPVTTDAPADKPDTPAEAPAKKTDEELEAEAKARKEAIQKKYEGLTLGDLGTSLDTLVEEADELANIIADKESEEGLMTRISGHFKRNWKGYALAGAALAVGVAVGAYVGSNSGADVAEPAAE